MENAGSNRVPLADAIKDALKAKHELFGNPKRRESRKRWYCKKCRVFH